MGCKELLAVVLSILMVQPSGLFAAPKDADTRSAVGMIAPRGSVIVGQTSMPSESALFAGDSVRTNNGSATVQYKGGARIFLGSDSAADFSAQKVQLKQGMMTFQTASSGMEFAASTLKLQPSTPKAAASLTLQNKQASVSVSEGTVNVIDPSGVQLASLRAGEARLFEEAPIATAPAPAAPPQGSGNSTSNSNGSNWKVGVGVIAGVVGAALGITGYIKANDANDNFDRQATLIQQVSSQNAALTAQVNTLRAQAAALQAFANAVSASSARQAALLQELSVAIADLARIQAELADIQQRTSALLTAIAARGGSPTAAELSQLQSFAARQGVLSGQLTNTTNTINRINTDLRNNPNPTLSPVT